MFYTEKEVQIVLTTEMLGTVPKDPEIYKNYIESKKPADVTENESTTVEKIEEKGWTGFHRDPVSNMLFIYDYMIRGFLKSAGEVLQQNITVEKEKKGVVSNEKLKGIKGKIDKYVFVFPRHIFLGKEAPDGVVERPLRAMTMQGPRVTLARSDYVNAGTRLNFTIKLLKNKEIGWDIITDLLKYGELSGLGQFRNGSYGRFMVERFKDVLQDKLS
jgi:hypothetical protein